MEEVEKNDDCMTVHPGFECLLEPMGVANCWDRTKNQIKARNHTPLCCLKGIGLSLFIG